jgi:putative phage-type endonuclease
VIDYHIETYFVEPSGKWYAEVSGHGLRNKQTDFADTSDEATQLAKDLIDEHGRRECVGAGLTTDGVLRLRLRSRCRSGKEKPMSEPIAVAMPGTPEWHDARRLGIGASEVAAICGVHPYTSALDTYLRKRGLIPDIEDNDAMRMGRKLEPVIISEFVERTGLEVKRAPCPLFRHPEYPFILATPDAELVNDELVEAKSMAWHSAQTLGEEGTDDIPYHFVMQAQQQMAVMGRDVCHVAVLVDGRDFRHHPVYRNEKLIALMIVRVTEFWERVQNADPPPPDWNHARTPELIKQMFPVTEGKLVELPSDVAELRIRYKSVTAQIGELEKESKSIDAQIRHAMGDASVARFPGYEFELARSTVTIKERVQEGYSYIRLTHRKIKDHGNGNS